jgi:hypothetical protein
MTLRQISASELYEIASSISKQKEEALVSKYYNEIIAAVHEGRFEITFILDSDYYGEVIPEAWSATETVERFFPGIKVSHDRQECSYTFSWHSEK